MNNPPFSISVLLATLLGGTVALASGGCKAPPDPTYVRECGECHAPFPARHLSAESWRAVLAGLPRHFGQDASLDPETAKTIEVYLAAHAGRRPTLAIEGSPRLRITETPWFRREHDEIPSRVWQSAAVKSPARCEACHQGAEQGRFSEHHVHLPKE